MSSNPVPLRGDVWWAQLDPVVGHEQGKKRPCLVVSTDEFNRSFAGLVLLIPFTSQDKGLPLRVRVDPPEGGLTKVSFVIPEQLRSASVDRLVNRVGSVSSHTMANVEDSLKILLDIR